MINLIAHLCMALQVKTNMRMLPLMKFLLKPHRMIAIFLGLCVLIFTQFFVFESFTPPPPLSDSVVKPVKPEEIKPAESLPKEEANADIESLYFADLIEALEEMEQDDFSIEDKANLKTAPKIAIVIDDVGMNKDVSWKAVRLDFPVTLSFLPYATDIQDMADMAEKNGHDVMLHIPMQPLDDQINAGDDVLKINIDTPRLMERIHKNLGALTHYVGVNNHMGSAFTQDEHGMIRLMAQLKKKDVFFLDSRTTAQSVGRALALKENVEFFERDIFLDHEETDAYMRDALENLESIAQDKGYAIAIGHPKARTLRLLKEWIGTARDKGFDLVVLSELLERR